MAGTAQPLRHKIIKNTALPYISNGSVTMDRPRYVAGSNVLTSLKGYAERRPGFATYTSDNYSTDTVSRMFTWRRWGSSFFVMLNRISGSQSKVYKLKVGTDTTFQLLHTSSSTEPFDFAVAANHVFFANGTDMMKYDGTTLTNWGITAPSSAISTSLGGTGLSPTIGYKYVIAWYNSTTGHTSSPSPLMSSYVKPVNQTVTITGNTTSDGQVTHARVYRTADGGSIYFEHPSSPVAYATWTASGLADSSADTVLSSTIAPLQNQNNRPTTIKHPKWFAGRLWGVKGDRVYYSGWEEIPLGTSDMPEECFPIDNYYPFGQECIGLGVAGDEVGSGTLVVLCEGGIHKISGDTLDTFTRGTIAKKNKGLRNRATVFETDKLCGWLDASNTIQVTDGQEAVEISNDIRPDLESITHSLAAMTAHDDGPRHWILLMDGGNSKIYAYDKDLKQWMPPWSVTSMESIASGETSAGAWKLFLGRGGKPLNMTPSTYQDESSNYTASATMGLVDLLEDRPDGNAAVTHVSVERNAIAHANVKILTDEDPSTGTYIDLSTTTTPTGRTAGTNLVEVEYKAETGAMANARRASVKQDWSAANSNFKVYSVDIAHEVHA